MLPANLMFNPPESTKVMTTGLGMLPKRIDVPLTEKESPPTVILASITVKLEAAKTVSNNSPMFEIPIAASSNIIEVLVEN